MRSLIVKGDFVPGRTVLAAWSTSLKRFDDVKVVIAPDKFKGTLTAVEAATAMAEGWTQIRPRDELILSPMADGGTGTLSVLASSVGGSELARVEVLDALGRPRTASWLCLPGRRAVVETAQAIGLDLITKAEHDPLRATSYGAGQLIAAATSAGSKEILVGLGGSATMDAGAGAAVAMGCRLLDAFGSEVELGGAAIAEVKRIARPDPPAASVVAMVDVMNPLLGPNGAQLYAPQKGGRPQDLQLLELALAHFAHVVERDVGCGAVHDRPGAGAAGGLGFALMALMGAPVRSGAEAVAQLVGFDDAVHGADIVITGEGALDAQTQWGKAPGYVADRGRKAGATVLAIVGLADEGAVQDFDRVLTLGPGGLDRPRELVRLGAKQLALEVVDKSAC